METAGYTTLSRQSGLMREMQVVANNIANSGTTGFRRAGVLFSEHVTGLVGEASVSIAHANGRTLDQTQGGLSRTGGTFDLAIQGEGYFLVSSPNGERLTRAGSFVVSPEGVLATPDGHALLDAGGAAVPAPIGAKTVLISKDGTMSADGLPVAEIGLWGPVDPSDLQHAAGVEFATSDYIPVENVELHQGFLEDSNVNPIGEIARMIEVQRAYEAGQKFLDAEDQRQKSVIQTLGR